MIQNIKKPSWFWHLTEGIRATFEFFQCLFFMAFYRYSKQGNQRPVLVIPGFLGSALSTALMRRFLRRLDYAVYDWGLGRNLGKLEDLPRLAAKIKAIQAQHGQKVTLIGWSLGGVYARELAKENPGAVQQVITMGSPFADLEAPNHARWIFELVSNTEVDPVWLAAIPAPPPLPVTAIYSPRDGIVPWQACMEQKPDELRRNVKVCCSHLGFVVYPEVFRIIVKALVA